ncbi:MAG: isoprenylcysteine carboxylmethyltransferase family protein [Pyrinomonadaceae bacterium]|nr:isoprenylcysteine carboxylmethyltransferase family protein [Pyrinomonadaceae bacterium]
MRYFLFAYLLIYFTIAFVIPTYRVWKRSGVNPITFRSADTAHDYIGKLFKIVMVSLVVVVLVYSFFPKIYSFLLPVFWLEYPLVRYTGVILLLLSLGWTVIAQLQMGNSWRIGIDEEKQTDLVQTGLFRFSRNPIFLGMIVTIFGFFMTIPNAFTLVILLIGFVLIQIQVRLEEEFLSKMHAASYDDYGKQVRRWL